VVHVNFYFQKFTFYVKFHNNIRIESTNNQFEMSANINIGGVTDGHEDGANGGEMANNSNVEELFDEDEAIPAHNNSSPLDALTPKRPCSAEIIAGRIEGFQPPENFKIVIANSRNNKTVLRSYGVICEDARIPDAIKMQFQCLASAFCVMKLKPISMGKGNKITTSDATKHLRSHHSIEGTISVKMNNTKISLEGEMH
jgi:hypothetical protein